MIHKEKYPYFHMLSIFHMASIITCITVTNRMILVELSKTHSFYITGGAFFIPIVFFIQDIATEIYGYYNARKMLFSSIFVFLLYGLILYLFSLAPCKYNTSHCQNFTSAISTVPRQVISFVISLAIGGTVNNYVLSKLKLTLNNKFLALRFISSTAIGEAIFQAIAACIAWYGTYHITDIIPLALAAYFYKVIFEIVATPFNIKICSYLKSIQVQEGYYAK